MARCVRILPAGEDHIDAHARVEIRSPDGCPRYAARLVRGEFLRLVRGWQGRADRNDAAFQLEGAVGGKTGYTNRARQTYVGQFKRGNAAIIVAIMGSETMWRDIRRLVDYGFEKKKQIRLAQLGRRSSTSAVR